MPSRALGSRYTLDREIGRGAVGSVWRGHRNDDGTVVAIKRLRAEVAEDMEIVRRFVQERALLTDVVHPNVVRVLDLVVEGSTLAIVMELVDGGDLRQEIDRRGTLTPAETASLGAGVARGLAAIHDGGVVHRDVKPANILLERVEGRLVPKVTDFGVARVTHGEITETTSATMIVGTPLYMAPEVIEERLPTAASDIYSFGILLYRMLTGVTPFSGDGGTYGVMRRQTELMPGRPEGLPDALWEIIERAVDKDPAARPEADALADELEGLAESLAGLPARTRLVHPPAGRPVGAARAETGGGITEGTVVRDRTGLERWRAAGGPGGESRTPEQGATVLGTTRHAGTVDAGAAGSPVDGADRSVRARAVVVGDRPAGAGRRRWVALAAALVVVLLVAGSLTWWLTRDTLPEDTTMPNLWGMSVEEAEEELGPAVEIETVDALADTVEPGRIIRQDPPVDEEHDGTVEVGVSVPTENRRLHELEPITGDGLDEPAFEAREIGENAFLDVAVSEPGVASGTWAWEVPAGSEMLRGTVGRWVGEADDGERQEADDSRVVAVEILGDGERLWNGQVTLDEPRDFTLDVEGVEELEVQFSVTSGGDEATAALGLANTRVLAPAGALPEQGDDG